MSHRTTIHKMMRQAGFVLVRCKKHFVYRNERGITITVPNHNRMNNITFKKLKKKIEQHMDEVS